MVMMRTLTLLFIGLVMCYCGFDILYAWASDDHMSPMQVYKEKWITILVMIVLTVVFLYLYEDE